MQRRLPPLAPLRAFEATVRLGSMTRAGEELGRTHGAISRQIHGLEDALGTALLEREGGAVRPTSAGAAFYASVASAFDTLEKATARVSGRRSASHVRLACGSTFATRWVVPRLPRFYEANPGISVSLTITTTSFQDASDYDVATTWDRLTYDVPRDENVVVLGDSCFVVVCRPDYPHRVEGATLEIETVLYAETMTRGLDRYQALSGHRIHAARSHPFPHMHLCIEGALGGLGATLVDVRVVEEELEEGRLVAPLGEFRVEDGFLAVYNPHRPVSPAMRRLVRWFAEEGGPGARSRTGRRAP